MFKNYENSNEDPEFSGEVLELDLSTLGPSVAGPKRPQDYIEVKNLKEDFLKCLTTPNGFKGFGVSDDKKDTVATVSLDGKEYPIDHGTVVIAAITSCTNTSNPTVMLAAALLAQKATQKGLKVSPIIKTSLSPGSKVVS